MNTLINGLFDFLAVAFDKIPFLNKLKGYRSVVGLAGLIVVVVLKNKGIGDENTLTALEVGFTGLSALALNAKGRE